MQKLSIKLSAFNVGAWKDVEHVQQGYLEHCLNGWPLDIGRILTTIATLHLLFYLVSEA